MTDTENKETITFDEFQAWLTGLIRGMNGQLPGVEEWKQIKQMMNKVVPQKEYIQNPPTPMPVPRSPHDQQWQWPQDRWPYYEIWCSDQSPNTTFGESTQEFKVQSTNTNTTVGFNADDTNKGLDPQLSLEIDNIIEINKGL